MMQDIKDKSKIMGPWKNPLKIKEFKNLNHKFLKRNRTLDINWKRLHEKIPEVLRSERSLNILDVASGNGATLEILRYYGHTAIGVDFTPGYEKGDWLYRPMIESQNLNCVNHDCSILPYPFETKQFDFLICYGAITFFKPIDNWPKVLDEFARLSKKGFLVGVNQGKSFNKGESLLDLWKHDEFKLESKRGSIYKWVSR